MCIVCLCVCVCVCVCVYVCVCACIVCVCVCDNHLTNKVLNHEHVHTKLHTFGDVHSHSLTDVTTQCGCDGHSMHHVV